jgi:hypothetical protein
MAKIYVVVEEDYIDGSVELKKAFTVKPLAVDHALELSKIHWRNVKKFEPSKPCNISLDDYMASGGSVTYPYVKCTDEWYLAQQFRVREVELNYF